MLSVTGSNGTYTFTSTVMTTGSAATPSGVVDLENQSSANPQLNYLTQAPTAPATPGVVVKNGPALPAGKVPGELSAQAVGVADFNRDGISDVVGAGENATILTLLGKGNGTFTPGATNNSGFGPDHIVVGDFNGDGFMDFAGINYYESSIVVYLGNGDGSFQAAITTAGKASPNSLVVGDFNHDGIPDLATTNDGRSAVSVYLGLGNGSFSYRSVALPAASPSLVTADINGDGNLDFVVAQQNSLQVLLGKGNGGFALGASLSVSQQPTQLFVGDFNDDGLPDLLSNSAFNGQTSLLLSQGGGAFAPPVLIDGGESFAITDINHDGNEDLAIGQAAPGNSQPVIYILFGDGQVNFTRSRYPITGKAFNDVSAAFFVNGDFNDDGNYDLLLGDSAGAKVLFTDPTETVQAIISNYTLPSGSYLIQAMSLFPETYAGSTSPSVELQGQP